MQVVSKAQPSRPKAAKGWQLPGKIYSELVTITPEVAQKMLQNSNAGNRPLSRFRVNEFTDSIVRGEWIPNSNSIGFDINGNLTDGQHRLNAVVKANRPIVSLVTYNLPPDSFKTTDIGKSRSSGDIASIIGMGKNARTVGSAANLLYYFQKGELGKTYAVRPTNTQIHVLLSNNRDLEKSASIGQSTWPALPASVGAFCHYIFSKIDQERADKFMEYVRTGANLSIGHPCLTLRNYMMEGKVNNMTIQQRTVIAVTILAWNYYRSGKKIKRLRWDQGTEFPKPI